MGRKDTERRDGGSENVGVGGIGREGGSEFEFELNRDFLGIRASTQDPTLSFHCTTLSKFGCELGNILSYLYSLAPKEESNGKINAF